VAAPRAVPDGTARANNDASCKKTDIPVNSGFKLTKKKKKKEEEKERTYYYYYDAIYKKLRMV
jgi:hypothetical protein